MQIILDGHRAQDISLSLFFLSCLVLNVLQNHNGGLKIFNI